MFLETGKLIFFDRTECTQRRLYGHGLSHQWPNKLDFKTLGFSPSKPWAFFHDRGIKLEPTDRWVGRFRSGELQKPRAVLDHAMRPDWRSKSRFEEFEILPLRLVHILKWWNGWLWALISGGLLWSGKALPLKSCKNSQGRTSLKLQQPGQDGPIYRLDWPPANTSMKNGAKASKVVKCPWFEGIWPALKTWLSWFFQPLLFILSPGGLWAPKQAFDTAIVCVGTPTAPWGRDWQMSRNDLGVEMCEVCWKDIINYSTIYYGFDCFATFYLQAYIAVWMAGDDIISTWLVVTVWELAARGIQGL